MLCERTGPDPVFGTATHRFEHAPVVLVVDAVPQRNVDSVVAALAIADVFEVSRSGEKLAVLVKRGRHDTIGRVERLLDSVSVVDVDVDVEDSRVIPQELEDTKYNVFRSKAMSVIPHVSGWRLEGAHH